MSRSYGKRGNEREKDNSLKEKQKGRRLTGRVILYCSRVREKPGSGTWPDITVCFLRTREEGKKRGISTRAVAGSPTQLADYDLSKSSCQSGYSTQQVIWFADEIIWRVQRVRDIGFQRWCKKFLANFRSRGRVNRKLSRSSWGAAVNDYGLRRVREGGKGVHERKTDKNGMCRGRLFKSCRVRSKFLSWDRGGGGGGAVGECSIQKLARWRKHGGLG